MANAAVTAVIVSVFVVQTALYVAPKLPVGVSGVTVALLVADSPGMFMATVPSTRVACPDVTAPGEVPEGLPGMSKIDILVTFDHHSNGLTGNISAGLHIEAVFSLHHIGRDGVGADRGEGCHHA